MKVKKRLPIVFRVCFPRLSAVSTTTAEKRPADDEKSPKEEKERKICCAKSFLDAQKTPIDFLEVWKSINVTIDYLWVLILEIL